MRKIAVLSLVFLSFFLFSPQQAFAAACVGVISGVNTTITIVPPATHKIEINMGGSSHPQNLVYQFSAQASTIPNNQIKSPVFSLGTNQTYQGSGNGVLATNGTVQVAGGRVTWTINNQDLLSARNRTITVSLNKSLPGGGVATIPHCDVGSFTTSIENVVQSGCKLTISQQRGNNQCFAPGCLQLANVTASVSGLKNSDGGDFNGRIRFRWQPVTLDGHESAVNGSAQHTTSFSAHGEHRVNVAIAGSNNQYSDIPGCEAKFSLVRNCGNSCNVNETDLSVSPAFGLCEQIADSDKRAQCNACFTGGGSLGGAGLWTAIGCIPTQAGGIIKTLIQISLGIGGGITLLLILAGAFKLSVSQGDPKAVEEAREQITSAVIGLLFIIFSITILRFIGIQVLQVPGFGVS